MAQVFVSPGVYTQEIDQTLRPSGGGGGVGGAAVIGLSEKGPAFAPITFTNAGVFTNRFGNKNDGAEGYSYQAINAFMNRGGNRSTFVRILGKDSVSMGKAGALVFPTSGTASTPDAAGNVILGIVRLRTGTDAIELLGTPTNFSITVGSDTISNISLDPRSPNYITTKISSDPVKENSDFAIPDLFVDTVYGYGLSSVTGEISNSTSAVDVSISLDAIGGGFSESHTPWVVSQNNGGSVSNLFRLHSVGAGDNENKSMTVQITNVKEGVDAWPTFDLQVLEIKSNSNDSNPGFSGLRAVKDFGSVSLDPTASNYIAKIVGDVYPIYDWSETPPIITYSGEYQVTNNYIRVEVASDITPSMKPAGVRGVPGVSIDGGTEVTIAPMSFVLNHNDDGNEELVGIDYADFGMVDRLKKTTTTAGGSTGTDTLISDKGYLNVSSTAEGGTLNLGDDITVSTSSDSPTVVTLDADYNLSAGDEVIISNSATTAVNLTYVVATASGNDFTAVAANPGENQNVTGCSVVIIYKSKYSTLTSSFQIIDTLASDTEFFANDRVRFNVPFFGGFDGFDYRADKVKSLNSATNSLSASYIDALNILSNKDIYDFDILVTPGVHSANTGEIPQTAINMVKGRGDAFYLLDIGTNADDMDANSRMGITTAISEASKYDSSYAATYYPWIRKRTSILPPSIEMLGVYAFNDTTGGGPWYAPAGFRRGSFSSEVSSTRPLTQAQRDQLYENNINPLSSFTNQGLAVFGQKTLQSKATVLDRVNVRRMLLKVRKDISRIARTFLFEQNSATVREQLLNRVNNVLSSVQSANGLTEFRAILDETTTTPDLIDRNIMMGKIFLKPTSAAEVIVFDFTVSPQGASFDEV